MRKRNTFLLYITLGVLLSCNGKKRPLSEGQKLNGSDNTLQTADNSPQKKEAVDNSPTPNATLFSDVSPLFEKHCMWCHGSYPPQINWLDYEVAKEYVENGELYNRVWVLKDDAKNSMPQGNSFSMTEEERQQIVKWIEDGGLQ